MLSDSYPFAVGRIRGLERRLLDPALFHRLEEQPFPAAVRTLADSGYGREAGDKADPDALVDAEMKALRADIASLAPDTRLTDPFWLEEDAVNIKLLLKARLLSEDAGPVFADGLFLVDDVREAVLSGDYSRFPDAFASRMAELEKQIGAFKSTAAGIDPLVLSAEVDRAVYGYVLARLKKPQGRIVMRYFSAKSDFTDLLSLLRARALRWDRRKFVSVLLGFGEINRKELEGAYDGPLDALERSVGFGTLYSPVRRALAAFFADNQSVRAAAAVFSRELQDVAGEERYDPFGVGPLVFYLVRRRNEGRRLRVLFAAKRSATDAR